MTTNEVLENLIPQYALNKSELDSYKKLCDDENKLIKDAMQKSSLSEYSAGGYTVKYVVQKRESMNDAKVLEAAHKYNLPIIKTIEVVDYDALEGIMYRGEMPQEAYGDINKARDVKEIVTLRVSAEKKK